MRIALDATYSVGPALSGVGVYSRELLQRLAANETSVEYDWFYRWKPFWRDPGAALPGNVTRRLLTDSIGDRSADLFHGLNQRLPPRRFRKQISTFHDLFVLSGEYSTPEFRQRFAAQAKQAAADSDLVIAVSEFTAGQLEQYLRVPRAGIRVIHHGLTPRAIPNLPREKVVLCTGAIQRRKNQSALVRAFRSLPADWTLVLAGAEGYRSQEVMQEIAHSGCANRIRITGYLSDAELAGWYGRASIFAFPSLDEGFGIPLVESMAAGIPIVTSNVSALPEVAGGAALLVNPRDDEDIASALMRLVDDKALRTSLIEAGKRRAAHFTWQNAVAQTLDAYRQVLHTGL